MDAKAIQRWFDDGGLRCTPQRYAVMAFLMKQNSHPTAAEIFEAVNRVDPRSSRATTYNNLRDLVRAGLVREVAAEGRVQQADWSALCTPAKYYDVVPLHGYHLPLRKTLRQTFAVVVSQRLRSGGAYRVPLSGSCHCRRGRASLPSRNE